MIILIFLDFFIIKYLKIDNYIIQYYIILYNIILYIKNHIL
jgi:hypothetical protein